MEQVPDAVRAIRCDIIEMIAKAQSGHPGGSLSLAEILVTIFSQKMRFDPSNPEWEDRDRLILSKGHGVPALYATLSWLGAIPREELWTLRQAGSRLQGHPARALLPVVEASTGSLGQGLSIAVGMALAGRLDHKDYHVFCVLGDGEIQEGQVWEAAMAAPKWKLSNLTAILDYNKGQLDGFVRDIMDIESAAAKWRAFNWHVIEVDGHDPTAIAAAVDDAKTVTDRPTMIVAHTVKGKGVSFMENDMSWHGKAPNEEQTKAALAELGC
ncbi:MAG: transketolase [Deltaproteobacteria bacterium]|nr:transketolase [Deltaproteobacteria bacterium]